MQVIEPGHVYLVEQIDPQHDALPQLIRFLRRSSATVTHPYESEGTNTQEIIRVAIDRTKYLNNLRPCEENLNALYGLRLALMSYEVRAYRRKLEAQNKGRGDHAQGDERYHDMVDRGLDRIEVKGKSLPIEDWPTGSDGHIDFELLDEMADT